MLTIAALLVSFFFALNIGASGTAASLGAAYGGGAISRKRTALWLAAVSVWLGAVLGGGEVVKTLSGGIIPASVMNVDITIMILVSACLTLFTANLLAVPLSTSEVTVGAVVGAGLAYHSLALDKLVMIFSVWLILPFAAFLISFGLGKLLVPIEKRFLKSNSKLLVRIMKAVLLLAGCYEAFSAGMNNVANAIGPLVGAGLIGSSAAILYGGTIVSLGALTMGGRVLETNAKKITDLSLCKSSTVSLTSGTLVLIASVMGIPVPLTQATTMSIFGIGTVDHGTKLWKNGIVKRVLIVWIASPIISIAITYGLVQVLLFKNSALAIVVFVTLGLIGIFLTAKKYKKAQMKSDASSS